MTSKKRRAQGVDSDLVPIRVELGEAGRVAADKRLTERQAPPELQGADWFRLKEYESVERWRPRDWYVAISSRMALERRIKRASTDASDIQDHFNMMYLSPIAPGGYILLSDRRAYFREGRLEFSPPISPDGLLGPVDPIEFAREQRILVVDTAASDAVLKETFAALLKELRRPSTWSKGFTENDMKLWATSRVIPFIDLKLYQLATGVQLSASEKAAALFRDWDDDKGTDPVDWMRKTTEKHARRLMTDASLKSMAAQLGGTAFVAGLAETKARRTGRPITAEPASLEPFVDSEVAEIMRLL